MTLRKYMILDIIILCVIAFLADLISSVAMKNLLETNHQVDFLTPSVVFVVIIYIRWNKAGIFANCGLLLTQLLLNGNRIFADYRYAIGIIVAYLSLALILLIPPRIKNKIKKSTLKSLGAYALLPWFVMVFLEYIIPLSLGLSVWLETTMILRLVNLILWLLVILVASRQTTFLVDMKEFLIKQQKKKEERK